MQAIVKEKRAPGLTVKSVPKPAPGPGEVLIAVRHAGVCGTDLHIADWNPWAQGRIKPPIVVGHEFAGEIESVGDGVTGLRAGHLVTAEGHIVCGHCLQCRTGNSHICQNTRIIGVDRDGAFAEYIAMPATNVLTLDGGTIPTEVGAIMDDRLFRGRHRARGRRDEGHRLGRESEAARARRDDGRARHDQCQEG